MRASASIPYFFEPVSLAGPRGTSTLVDGGLVSNYPISMFDRTDGRPARWPTIGIRLGAPAPDTGDVHRVRGAVPLGISLVQTAIEACQAEHVLEPCNVARSVAVDTGAVSAIDFDITDAQRAALDRAGRDGVDDLPVRLGLRRLDGELPTRSARGGLSPLRPAREPAATALRRSARRGRDHASPAGTGRDTRLMTATMTLYPATNQRLPPLRLTSHAAMSGVRPEATTPETW